MLLWIGLQQMLVTAVGGYTVVLLWVGSQWYSGCYCRLVYSRCYSSKLVYCGVSVSDVTVGGCTVILLWYGSQWYSRCYRTWVLQWMLQKVDAW